MANQFQQYIAGFISALNKINVEAINTSGYSKQYAVHTIKHKEFYTNLYARVLNNCLQQTSLSVEEITLVDFGSGNGFLSLFASFCGLKDIVACEVREEFVQTSKQLQQQLGLDSITWITGNEQTLLQYGLSYNQKQYIVVGTDVIEHVYDLNKFFITFRQLQAKVVAFTTASVYDNYFKRKQLYKLMYKDEYSSNTDLHVPVNSKYGTLCFLEIRKQILKEIYPSLQDTVIADLAKATRGFKKEDIIKLTDKYLYTEQLPKPIAHPYNTCDPITGSFTERMLTTKEYRQLFESHGYTLSIINEQYNQYQGGIKGIIQTVMNAFIKLLPKAHVIRCISPSILLLGKFER